MDIKTLLDNLREEVSCSVCSTIFKDPKYLPCLHSFCLKCLQDWYKVCGSDNTIRCPNCQAISRVPASGDLKDLPTSFYLNGLIDVLAIKECNTSEVRCGNCDKKTSETYYCFQCCLFWCKECKTCHDVIRSNRGHRVLAIKEFQDKDYEDVLKRPVFCQKQLHREKKLEFFCKECETALCQTCVTLGHAGHTLVLIEEEAERLKPEVKTLIETQRHNLQAKMNVISQLDEDCDKLLQENEDTNKNIQMFADSLIAVIEVKKQSALQILENQTKKAVDSITAKKTEMTNQITVIQSSLEKADKLFARSTDSEILQLKKSLETIFEGVEQTESINRDIRGCPVLAFTTNQKMFNTVNMEEIGSFEMLHKTKASQSVAEGKGLKEACVGREAQFVVTTRNTKGKQCYSTNDHIMVDLIRDEQKGECKMKVMVNDNTNGTYEVSYFPRDHGKCKLFVKVNGEHIHGGPFAVQVKPFKFRHILSFGQKGVLRPWGVAVNDQDEIAVTDTENHTVRIFSIDGGYLRSLGGYFGSLFPSGIAFGKNGNIFVAATSVCMIKIFSREGKYVGEFGGKGSPLSQLSRPLGLSVNSDGNVIVADAGNRLVKIFSPNGEFQMKIGQQGSFNQPWHCIQYDSYFIVSDNGEDCVKVFDTGGNFLYNIGKRGKGPGEFCRPQCLSVNKLGQLLVCDAVNQRIQVFELDGSLVGMFGGKNLGTFVRPNSSAVLRNGQIVVADNNCIQILE